MPCILVFFSAHIFRRSEIKNTETKELVTCSHNFNARLTGLRGVGVGEGGGDFFDSGTTHQ